MHVTCSVSYDNNNNNNAHIEDVDRLFRLITNTTHIHNRVRAIGYSHRARLQQRGNKKV